ncbi:MAG: prepilin-type N-terminal cleavage/methylation domain-containing protein [Fimbriimonadaceae bacterium]
MAKRKAFTLIELLVVIAIIAILAAILFPVFSQAKAAAKQTSSISGLKQIALALQGYSTDFDDMAVFEYGYAESATNTNQYHYNTTWVGRIYPYVKNQSVFFDKVYPEIKDYNRLYQDPYYSDPYYSYTWAWVTTFSLNTDGYSRSLGGSNCNSTETGGAGIRSLTAFEEPASRLAVTPTRYGTIPDWSWMRFIAYQASWPTADRYANGFSWYQLVFDARKQYNTRFIGAYADGHAARFGPEKFVKYYVDTPSRTEANTFGQWCQQMYDRDLWKFWGPYWKGN